MMPLSPDIGFCSIKTSSAYHRHPNHDNTCACDTGYNIRVMSCRRSFNRSHKPMTNGSNGCHRSISLVSQCVYMQSDCSSRELSSRLQNGDPGAYKSPAVCEELDYCSRAGTIRAQCWKRSQVNNITLNPSLLLWNNCLWEPMTGT